MLTWQIAPTVVMGRNQDAKTEIDLSFCRKEGIDVIRRKSGGGSIYADHGNIMTSLITGGGAVEPIFAEYSAAMAECLSALGANVEVSGRNDIRMAGGGKICGNAFYHLSNRNIVHGTMLYDTDARLMRGALTPERAKLQSKGVKSVESRISLLKDAIPHIGIKDLLDHIRQYLTDSTLLLSDTDIRHILDIEAGYYAPSYLYGKDCNNLETTHSYCKATVGLPSTPCNQPPTRPGTTYHCGGRIEGCGTVSLDFHTEAGKITAVTLRGDYFEFGNANDIFVQAFLGCPFNAAAMLQAIDTHTPHNSIRGLQRASLYDLIKGMFG